MPDAPPPEPPARIEQIAAGEIADQVAAYQAEVAAFAAGSAAEGYVDPHVAQVEANLPDDVTGLRDEGDTDVDPIADQIERTGDLDPAEDPDADPDADPDPNADPDADPDPNADPAAPQVDPAETLARTLRQANPKLTFAQAAAEAERILAEGKDPAVADPDPEPETPTVDALTEERRNLDKAWRKAVRDLADDEEIDRMEARLAEIDELLPQAREADAKRAEKVTSAYEQAAQRAVDLYPDAAKEGSPLFKRMAEIHQTAEDNGDPLISDPNKALIIAQMAARDLRIAPKAGPAKPAATPPGKRGPASSMTALPAAAAARRAAAPTTPAVVKQLETIKSPHEFEQLMRGLAGRHA